MEALERMEALHDASQEGTLQGNEAWLREAAAQVVAQQRNLARNTTRVDVLMHTALQTMEESLSNVKPQALAKIQDTVSAARSALDSAVKQTEEELKSLVEARLRSAAGSVAGEKTEEEGKEALLDAAIRKFAQGDAGFDGAWAVDRSDVADVCVLHFCFGSSFRSSCLIVSVSVSVSVSVRASCVPHKTSSNASAR